MKKLACVLILCLLATALYAGPPMPGTKHGGCIHLPGTQAPFRSPSQYAADSSLQKISPLSPAVGGDRNILVILVNFQDVTFNPSRTADYYKTFLGKEGEPAGSMTMRRYYQDMSGGKLNLTFTVIGPYTLDYDKAHYGTNEIKSDDMDMDTLVGDIAWEAVDKAITNNPSVFSAENLSNWDYDGDGTIDTFFVIHAGIGEEEYIDTDDIFSLRWSINYAYQSGRASHQYYSYGGKIFNDYTVEPEYLFSTGKPPIGTFCHEYGHILGLVDLYDITYETVGTGTWSLMDLGSWGCNLSADPAPLLAWEKYYLGWLTPTTITPTARPQTFNFSDIESSKKAWKINLTDNGSQYLILEGKKKNTTGTGWFVQEDGLLIIHITEDILDVLWEYNAINYKRTGIHGIDVVEAASPYYETTGQGTLWQGEGSRTTTSCFRSDTKTTLMPYYGKTMAGIGLLVSLIFLHRKRKKLGIMLLICCLACFMACDLGGHSSHSGKILGLPNTNYYETTEITSKTGISGITITVNCPAGSSSGSFTVVKEKRSSVFSKDE